MASIVFAAVIATLLFFFFERTRGFGVIGVFALIAINPLFFTPLFVFLAVLYLYLTIKGEIIMPYSSNTMDAIVDIALDINVEDDFLIDDIASHLRPPPWSLAEDRVRLW